MTMKLENRLLSDLRDYPQNPRTIHDDQFAALKRGIQEFGMVQPLIVNPKGEVIGGNQRLHALRELGFKETQVIVVDLPTNKEKSLNLALNKIHGDWNMPALQQIMADLDKADLGLAGFSDAEVKAMLSTVEVSDKTLKQVTQEMISPPIEEDEEGEPIAPVSAQSFGGGYTPTETEKVLLGTEAAAKGVPDAVFPSDNEFGIPSLRLDMCAGLVQAPVLVYGSTHHIDKITGTWLFYCYDAQFEELWRNPDKIANSSAYGAGELNFSATEQTPKAIVLYDLYRKRWIARYWQERGIRIVVDIHLAPKWNDINLLGVPKGWSAYCTRAYTEHVDWLDDEFALARDRCGRDPLFLVYGGGKVIREKCADMGWLHIDESENAIRAGKLINQRE